MAKKYGVSVPQLCIRYTLQLGTIALPKTANPAHMETNVQVNGWMPMQKLVVPVIVRKDYWRQCGML